MANYRVENNTLYRQVSPYISDYTEEGFTVHSTTNDSGSKDSYPAWYMMDGNINTYWRTYPYKGMINHKLEFTYPDKVLVNAIYIQTPGTKFMPYNWVFEGSNDNENFTTLYTAKNITFVKSLIPFENKVPYKYYRVVWNSGSPSAYTAISEFVMYEAVRKYVFTKILEDNLPSVVSDGIDRIYFTEKGNLFINSKEGVPTKLVPTISNISKESDNAIEDVNGFYLKDFTNKEVLNGISVTDDIVYFNDSKVIVNQESEILGNGFKNNDEVYSVTVDSELDEESENLVTNKAVTTLINTIQGNL